MRETKTERRTRRTVGVIAALLLVGLVGWGIYEATDDDVETGAEVDDTMTQETADSVVTEDQIRQTESTTDTGGGLY